MPAAKNPRTGRKFAVRDQGCLSRRLASHPVLQISSPTPSLIDASTGDDDGYSPLPLTWRLRTSRYTSESWSLLTACHLAEFKANLFEPLSLASHVIINFHIRVPNCKRPLNGGMTPMLARQGSPPVQPTGLPACGLPFWFSSAPLASTTWTPARWIWLCIAYSNKEALTAYIVCDAGCLAK